MPKLWSKTVEAHRSEVRDAVLDATASLVAEKGLRSVTMSEIAGQTGIGRATLYKYYSDVEAILLAWHERQISAHFAHLAEVRDRADPVRQRLADVLEAYAVLSHGSHGHHDAELAAFLHRDVQVHRARQQLHDMIQALIADGAATGDLRTDVAPDELAHYCLHALTAAGALSSKAAVHRLVSVILAGLRFAESPAGRRAISEEASPEAIEARESDRHHHDRGVADSHTRPPHRDHSVKPAEH